LIRPLPFSEPYRFVFIEVSGCPDLANLRPRQAKQEAAAEYRLDGRRRDLATRLGRLKSNQAFNDRMPATL
jgi:hypothetical protein